MNARQSYLPGNLGNFTAKELYLKKKMQQSKIISHFSYKFKILLLSQADLFKLPSVLSTYFTYV